MVTQRYSVSPHPVETLLTWTKSGEIAIPEIQRPFAWAATKVRNLLGSVYFVLALSEINIAIDDKPPEKYFAELLAQCDRGKKKYGGIRSLGELKSDLRARCQPPSLLDAEAPDYDAFLAERRKIMAKNIRDWFKPL